MCPRCGSGLVQPELLEDEEASSLLVMHCQCGHYFGEPLLDHHHALPEPPPPRPWTNTPTWDPTFRRLRYFMRPDDTAAE